MEVRTQQVIYGILEAFAAHNILHYLRGNNEDESKRLAMGATMAGFGYVFGPELEARVRSLGDTEFTDEMRQRTIYAAGGALIGTVLGRAIGPKVYESRRASLERALEEAGKEGERRGEQWIQSLTEKPPHGIVTIGSVLWLGYSVFYDGKTPEEQKRHLWGLGSGAVGYMYGPKVLRKFSNMLVPKKDGERVVELYEAGIKEVEEYKLLAGILGAVAGGAVAAYKGPEIVQAITDRRRIAGPDRG